ncbi:MAG: nitrous oxide reductase family maturation protein NosD [Candidatus Odinarchaeota archaeon]
MRVKNGVYWTAGCLVLIMILGSIASIASYCVSDLVQAETSSGPREKELPLSSTTHAPIAIDGDANFSATASAEGWPGNGSFENPYVIEGLDIDLGGAAGHCININNTLANFTVRDCYLTGANMSYGAGIYLENVSNGKLIGNTIYNNVINILLDQSHSVLVERNIAFDSDYGIVVNGPSSNNTIADNNCSFNSLHGIFLGYSSNNNTVIDNTCSNNVYGIDVYESDYDTVIGNDCKNNLFYGVLLSNASYNIVADNIINNSSRGIYLDGSMYNTVVNNICFSNSNSGILVFLSDSNTVIGNNFTSNSNGIDIKYSSFNTVANNTSTSNTNIGISLFYSVTAKIQWNAFVNNPTNGLDEYGLGNVFDSNYWSDYAGNDSSGDGFGDTPYTFTGNSDAHPLMYSPFAPNWLHIPVDQVVEFGNIFEYHLEFIITEFTAPYDLSVDDLANFVVDYDDTIMSKTALPVGVYTLQVVVTNIYGYKTEGAFTLAVEDTIPPFITSPEDITYTKGEGSHEIAWWMSDLSPLIYRVLLNGTEITSSPFNATSLSFSMTLEDKDPGVYNYSMVAQDIWGNIAIDTVIVMVLPIPLLESLLPWLSVGAVAVIVLVVIIFLFQKRKSS